MRTQVLRCWLFACIISLCLCLAVPGWALHQLQNGDFASDATGWTYQGTINDNAFPNRGWTNAEGNPSGCWEFRTDVSNTSYDGIVDQSFTTPSDPVYASFHLDHRINWSGTDYRRLTYQVDILEAGADFYNFVDVNNPDESGPTTWQLSGWTAPVLLSVNTTYTFRVTVDRFRARNGNTDLQGYFDNMFINTSPSGLEASASGSTVVLTWTASTGQATLHGTNPYRVYRSLVSGGPWTQVGTATTNTWTDASPPSAEALLQRFRCRYHQPGISQMPRSPRYPAGGTRWTWARHRLFLV